MSEFKTYEDFIASKRKVHKPTGFDVPIENLNDNLFPFQKFVVHRALVHGKYGVFSGTGTGKTRMELVWSYEVSKYTNKPVLILAPLAVAGQTILEGERIGVKCQRLFDAINSGEFLSNKTGVYIINYDQLENIFEYIHLFGGIALDEASLLKNHEGAIRNKLIEWFSDTEFKSVFTATPSPNDPMELGNYSEFLDVMPRNEMLAMYFVHDGGQTSQWRIKGHAKKRFWEFVSGWAIMFQHPKDIGVNQHGYDLPLINLVEKQIITEKRDNNLLFNDVAVSATNFNQELRITIEERLNAVADIVNSSDENFVIWIKLNSEEEYLKKLIPDAVVVTGSDSNEYKEKMLLAFADGKVKRLITKTKIAGYGMNFQCCHNTIFASPDFSFEQVYQAIRRFLRFGQKFNVNVWLVTTDTMHNVIQTFKKKAKQFEEMQAEMTNATNSNLYVDKKGKLKRKFKEYKTDNFMYQLGDCVILSRDVPSNSIGLSFFSPPFPLMYCYSDEVEDMGNCKDFNEFFIGFNFLLPELFRVMWSGRNVVVHCMDIPIQKGKEGFIGLRDFSGMIIDSFQKAGFIYHSRVTLRKDPVTEMQRTKALGLLHKQIKKDAAMSRVGIPDYLLVFRKPGEHEHPIIHQDTDPSKENYLPVNLWQKYAEPIWDDIDYGDTLNGKKAREEDDERHIAPLQLETNRRILHLWSNEGDTILTPYGGIGSEGFEGVKLNRKAILFELKESYFKEGIKNLISAEKQRQQKTLFTT